MKIAIQGHPTRGKEVIQILESLGGIDNYCLDGHKTSLAYYIYESGNIGWADLKLIKNEYKLYTLEEFEKEFPFKVGDKVFHKALKDYFEIIKFDPSYDYSYQIKGKEVFNCKSEALEFYKEMKTRTINLSLDKAKEWYKKGGELKEIALQAFTENELNPLPRSWEEFCENYPVQKGECWLDEGDKIGQVSFSYDRKRKNWVPSRESAEAHLALIQLEQLRNCWWNGWEPIWDCSEKWCIHLWGNELGVGITTHTSRFLTFPTKEMAEEFLECFRDLIELARDLI